MIINKVTKKYPVNVLNTIIVFLPVFWIFSALIAYADGRKDIVYAVIVSCFFIGIKYGTSHIIDNIKESLILKSLITLTIIAILLKHYNGYSSSTLRILISITIYIAFVPKALYKNLYKIFPYLILLGSVTSLLYCTYYSHILGLGRGWSINPIPYSTISASLVIISLIFSQQKEQPYQLFYLSFFMSLNALIMSQTRGTALALSLSAFIVISFLFFKKKINLKGLALIGLLALFSTVINGYSIKERIDQTESETSHINTGNNNTSIGHRLEMWKAAWLIVSEYPFKITGHGDENIILKEELASEGKVLTNIVKYTHFHNQYIDSYIKHGTIGLLILFILFILPAYHYLKDKPDINILGLAVLSVYAIASLTDVPLNHAQPLVFLITIMFILESKNKIPT